MKSMLQKLVIVLALMVAVPAFGQESGAAVTGAAPPAATATEAPGFYG